MPSMAEKPTSELSQWPQSLNMRQDDDVDDDDDNKCGDDDDDNEGDSTQGQRASPHGSPELPPPKEVSAQSCLVGCLFVCCCVKARLCHKPL